MWTSSENEARPIKRPPILDLRGSALLHVIRAIRNDRLGNSVESTMSYEDESRQPHNKPRKADHRRPVLLNSEQIENLKDFEKEKLLKQMVKLLTEDTDLGSVYEDLGKNPEDSEFFVINNPEVLKDFQKYLKKKRSKNYNENSSGQVGRRILETSKNVYENSEDNLPKHNPPHIRQTTYESSLYALRHRKPSGKDSNEASDKQTEPKITDTNILSKPLKRKKPKRTKKTDKKTHKNNEENDPRFEKTFSRDLKFSGSKKRRDLPKANSDRDAHKGKLPEKYRSQSSSKNEENTLNSEYGNDANNELKKGRDNNSNMGKQVSPALRFGNEDEDEASGGINNNDQMDMDDTGEYSRDRNNNNSPKKNKNKSNGGSAGQLPRNRDNNDQDRDESDESPRDRNNNNKRETFQMIENGPGESFKGRNINLPSRGRNNKDQKNRYGDNGESRIRNSDRYGGRTPVPSVGRNRNIYAKER